VELLDEKGRLFGLVNVIDVLVVLFVFAVVVAGAALVFFPAEEPAPEPEPEMATTHVTLDLGSQSEVLLDELNEGDTYSPNNQDSLTITDIYFTPTSDGQRALVRVELTGEQTGGSVQYGDAPPRLGRTLDIATSRYRVSGRIQALGTGGEIQRESTTVVLSGRLTAAETGNIAVGDEFVVGGRTVGTLEDLAVYSTSDANQHQVYAEIDLGANRQQGDLQFAGSALRSGQTVALPGDGYTLSGTVERVNGGLEREDKAILLRDTVDIEDAERIAEGDIVSVGDHKTATVERVSTYETGDPDQRRVFVGASLTTVKHGERPMFGGTNVQRGNEITLRTETYRLTGPIRRVGSTEQRGTPASRTVTFRLEGIHEDLAESIEPGLRERSGGATIVEVTGVEREPSTILIRGQDAGLGVYEHPTDRDVTITATVQVRETTSGIRFRGEPIRQGDRVSLDLGVTTVEPIVSRIE
jgi:hypothetical protein